MAVFVRSASQEDLAFIEGIENAADSLLIELLRPERWEPASTGLQRDALHGFIMVSAEIVGGPVVGFVHVIEGVDFAHLEQLSVLPSHGRRGHGRTLIEAAKSEAKEHGRDRMTLRTFGDVPWNAPFYAVSGFVESEARTEFHRRLVQVEIDLGLPLLGRRVEMTVPL